MRSLFQLSVAAVIWLPIAAAAALPEPAFDGVVVAERTATFSYESRPWHPLGPQEPIDNAYRGIVQQRVIRDTDGTYDFLFHITLEPASFLLGTFTYSWQVPASFSVAHHEAIVAELPEGYLDSSRVPVGPLRRRCSAGSTSTCPG